MQEPRCAAPTRDMGPLRDLFRGTLGTPVVRDGAAAALTYQPDASVDRTQHVHRPSDRG